MWRFKLTRCSTSYIPPRTEEVGAALHMLGAQCWSYNTQKLFCIILFREILVCIFFGKIHHLGAHFWLLASAWRFEMNENGSCLARKWRIRAGIEPNTMIGQLVKTWTPIGCGTTNISDTKRHTHNWLLVNLMPTRTHGIENNFCFSEGQHSDMTMSVTA